MSVVLRPPEPDAAKVTLTAAVAVSRALDAEIKWLNDILMNGKKVCGILAESSNYYTAENAADPFVVLGIGVNLNNTGFPDRLNETATSVFIERGVKTDIHHTAEKLMKYLYKYYQIMLNDGFEKIIDLYSEKCVTLGRRVKFNGTESSGTARGISPDGGLIVETVCGHVTLHSGEARIEK